MIKFSYSNCYYKENTNIRGKQHHFSLLNGLIELCERNKTLNALDGNYEVAVGITN